MKGQILDVYPEGEDTFRACVLEAMGNDKDLVRVVNLDTAKTGIYGIHECEKPVIENIFDLNIEYV